MAQEYLWPSVSVTATNPSVGPNGGSPSASSSTLVAGQDPSGDQQPLQTDASGNLLVALVPSPASTQDVNIAEFGGTTMTIGQKNSAGSIPVVLASDQGPTPVFGTVQVEQTIGANLHVQVDASALPTGASTSALQTSTQAILSSRLSGSLVPTAYDEIQLTYTGDNITTAVYKLATVTVKTLTLSYTGDRLDSVVAS